MAQKRDGTRSRSHRGHRNNQGQKVETGGLGLSSSIDLCVRANLSFCVFSLPSGFTWASDGLARPRLSIQIPASIRWFATLVLGTIELEGVDRGEPLGLTRNFEGRGLIGFKFQVHGLGAVLLIVTTRRPVRYPDI